MSFEAITTINEAEENAKRCRAQALAEAKAAEESAEACGKATIEDALKKAGEELQESFAQADTKAAEAAKQMADDTDQKIAIMRAQAEKRLDKAASLIVERVVNG